MIEKFPPARMLLLLFGHIGRRLRTQFESLKGNLRGARMSTTYHNYFARSMLYAVFTFVFVELGIVILSLVFFRTTTLTQTDQYLLAFALGFPAIVISYTVYRVRLYVPKYISEERARAIELSLPNTTNFLLALSRAGVPTEKTLELLADQSEVLGEAAEEFRYAWRDVEYFGADVVSGLRYISRTTKLDDLSDFIDGYIRTLTGRGNVEAYLEGEMDELFEKAELEQENFLNTLSVLAEVFVALFVALPIFSIIILIVMGFIGASDILTIIRLVVYAILPLTALGFLVFLDTFMDNPLSSAGKHYKLETTDIYEQSLTRVDEYERATLSDQTDYQRTLKNYKRRRRLYEIIRTPVLLLRRRPIYSLYLGLILGTIYVGGKLALSLLFPGLPLLPRIPPFSAPPFQIVAAIDATIVEGTIIVLFTYGAFYELRSRYLSGVEDALPDFLAELEQQHEMGMSLSRSLQTIRRKGMGRLNVELERISKDLNTNSQAIDALRRSANRVRSPVYTRTIILLSAASEAANRLGPVIDALSRRARLSQRLREERESEMSLYVIIIYIAFLVFMGILMILQESFFPQIPEGGFESGLGGTGLGGTFNQEAYEVLFFHMGVIQGIISGLVGGQMSEGNVSAGVKHSLVLVIVAYILFILILPSVNLQL